MIAAVIFALISGHLLFKRNCEFASSKTAVAWRLITTPYDCLTALIPSKKATPITTAAKTNDFLRNLNLDSTLTLKLICQHLRCMPRGKGRGHEHLDSLQRASAIRSPFAYYLRCAWLLLFVNCWIFSSLKQKQWKKVNLFFIFENHQKKEKNFTECLLFDCFWGESTMLLVS